MSGDDRRRAGFKRRTRLSDALDRLLAAVEPHGRRRRVALASADGRTLAESVEAPTAVPGYDRAAVDGYAVRASDTFGASDRSPAVLPVAGSADDGAAVAPGRAVRVHTGSEVPAGADAVVRIAETDPVGSDVEVFDAVTEGENVEATGEDVAAGQRLFEPGHVLRPSDLGLLKSVGVDRVDVYDHPTVGVVPTGEELVQADPGPGEVVETNGLVVSRLAVRWGGNPTYRNVVTDDRAALRAAVQRDLTKDIVVTTGGTSVGERDLVPEVVSDLGEVLVHGVAVEPGHPVALGVVEETPVVMLPGHPVACMVDATQFLRPAVKRAGGGSVTDPPTVHARLERKIPSGPGTRTFARVRLSGPADDSRDGPARVATPTWMGGAGVLSSATFSDGWVVVPEALEGYPAGETVAVERWGWSA
jgi:molybdopterin molybdotransferase